MLRLQTTMPYGPMLRPDGFSWEPSVNSDEALRDKKNDGWIARHVLGAVGVLASGVLIAVSAAMNWRFGYSLGRSELDGMIYGTASAAADCLKALVPFFFFSALRQRMWSQAAAAAVVGIVVTGYSLMSAFGHAALNRNDTTGHRMVEARAYKDLRDDLRRAQEQLSWVPPHRPSATARGEIEGLKVQRLWKHSDGCQTVDGKAAREFCQKYHAVVAEMGSGQQADVLEARIAELESKLAQYSASSAAGDADPQAAVLARVLGFDIDQVQLGLTVFVAVLLEVGSTMGMYMAFSQWRIYEGDDDTAQSKGTMIDLEPSSVPGSGMSVESTNDDRLLVHYAAQNSEIQLFCEQRVEQQDDHLTSATGLYEAYSVWCEGRGKQPVALPMFAYGLGELGFRTVKNNDGVWYIDLALKPDPDVPSQRRFGA